MDYNKKIAQLHRDFESNWDFSLISKCYQIKDRKKFETFEKKFFDLLAKYPCDQDIDDDKNLGYLIKCYIDITGNHGKIKSFICNNPYLIYYYCCHIGDNRWEEAESVVLKDIEIAVKYACDVICNRWEVLEPIILASKNAKFAIDYFEGCYWDRDENYHSRWLEAEPIILKNIDCAVKYTSLVIGRVPEAENILLKSIEDATNYVKNHKFRWPAYEKKIAKKPSRMFDYAKFVLGGRLPEELHNRMLMDRMEDSKGHGNKYFEYLENLEAIAINFIKTLDKDQKAEFIRKIKLV